MDNNFKQIFDKVQKPGRYIGEETNIVRKEHSPDKVSVVLSYPDMYEVGMSYLGLIILYHLLNERDDIVCERVFAPWDDMERELKNFGQKLFSLETRTDLNKFDIIGFSLSYELTFTNVLNMLSLGGVTVKSADRSENEPIVIAGGACCYNPEPMSAFVDVFVIGDGESALPGLIDRYKELRDKGCSRMEIIKGFAGLEGVYVPVLYKEKYQDNKFIGLETLDEDVPSEVKKAQLPDLENAYYPEKQIVPLVKVVHGRMTVEIMRGCPNRCRFCQASAVNRPVRLRSVERIREICRNTYSNTGYERIALLSLSSINYPHLIDLVKGLKKDFPGREVGMSIPSLKIDEAFYDLPEMMAAVRKTGLTFAPESASDDIRKSLGKDVDMEILCKSARIAFQHGWRRIKLYFMVGFTGASEDEAQNIVKLAREVSRLKAEVSKGNAEIKVSVNPFMPKPQTPLQWIGMRSKEELVAVRNKLHFYTTKKIKIEFTNLEQSMLETCIGRGDRRMAEVIYAAWQNGAKLDGWRDFFDFSIWNNAFKEKGLSIEEYACKTYGIEDALPWDHINVGIDKEWFISELKKSGLYQDMLKQQTPYR